MVEFNTADINLKRSIKAKSERSKPNSQTRQNFTEVEDLERGGVQTPDLDMLKTGQKSKHDPQYYVDGEGVEEVVEEEDQDISEEIKKFQSSSEEQEEAEEEESSVDNWSARVH